VRVGDRPVAIALDDEARTAYVACYLDDSIVEVDLDDRKVKRTLRLGSAPRGDQHAGARVFFDSDRSRGGWYSCNSCHPDGGTRGHVFDTPSDGDGLAKKSPDLRGTTLTGPWSWLGGFEVLQQQVAASLEKTMAVDHPPTDEQVEQVIAFLRSLGRPRAVVSSEILDGDPARGEELFERGDCARCHRPPTYTIKATRDVGISDPRPDAHNKYNPPSLIGLRDRYRYLHDGRAESLWAVFREHNAEGKHGKVLEFSDAELRDLIAFLKTL
jgi:cytochrome c peroxidase